MSLFNVPSTPSSSCLLTVYYHTDATDWNQTLPVRDSALGWTVWPSGRSHPKHRAKYDATIVAYEDLNLPQHSGASSSSKHTAASTVPTLSKLGSLGTGLRKLSADYDSVASRTSIKETCADMDHETVVSSLFESVLKGKRDRAQNIVQTLKNRQHLHKIPERKAEVAVRREKLAQRRLYEAEANVEVKHWEKRNSDIALYEIKQEFESQRSQVQQANQWADQAQRDKLSLYRELEMRNRLFRENQSKDPSTNCQEIEELRRICCEETD